MIGNQFNIAEGDKKNDKHKPVCYGIDDLDTIGLNQLGESDHKNSSNICKITYRTILTETSTMQSFSNTNHMLRYSSSAETESLCRRPRKTTGKLSTKEANK